MDGRPYRTVIGPQYVSDLRAKTDRKPSVDVKKRAQVPGIVHVGTRGQERGRPPGPPFKILLKRRQERRGRPGKPFELITIKLVAPKTDQVGPVPIGGGPENGRAVGHGVRHGRPIDLVETGTITPDRNDLLVSLRKRVGDGVRKARAETGAALLLVGDFHDRQPAGADGLARVLIKRLGHPSVLRVVPLHELLVLPLPLRAVTEEQNGGMGISVVDNRGEYCADKGNENRT